MTDRPAGGRQRGQAWRPHHRRAGLRLPRKRALALGLMAVCECGGEGKGRELGRAVGHPTCRAKDGQLYDQVRVVLQRAAHSGARPPRPELPGALADGRCGRLALASVGAARQLRPVGRTARADG